MKFSLPIALFAALLGANGFAQKPQVKGTVLDKSLGFKGHSAK